MRAILAAASGPSGNPLEQRIIEYYAEADRAAVAERLALLRACLAKATPRKPKPPAA